MNPRPPGPILVGGLGIKQILVLLGLWGLLIHILGGAPRAAFYPSKRKSGFSSLYQKELIVFGGRGAHKAVLSEFYSVNLSESPYTFTELNPIIPGRFNGCSASKKNGNLLVFGGYLQFYGQDDPKPAYFSNELWEYDRSWRSWRKVFPAKRNGVKLLKIAASVCALNHDESGLYVVGGNSPDGPTNGVNFIHLQTGELTSLEVAGDIPPFKGGCAASYPLENMEDGADHTRWIPQILWFGGRNSEGYMNTLFELQKKGETYRVLETQVADGPPARNHHGCAQLPGKFAIFGGRKKHNAKGFLSDLWVFDLKSGKWDQLLSNQSAWPSPRFLVDFHYSPEDHGFYIFGGQTPSGLSRELWFYGLSYATMSLRRGPFDVEVEFRLNRSTLTSVGD